MMNTLRNIALGVALIGTAAGSFSSSIEVNDPTVAGTESYAVMKKKSGVLDVEKMTNPILNNEKIDNPILSPLSF